MRFIGLILILFTLTFNAAAQSVSDTQKSLFTKVTATWCPLCGSWGWNFYDAIEELDDPNVVLIRVNYSGGLKNSVSMAFADNLGATYQPEFYVNEAIYDVGPSNWEDQIPVVEDAIKSVTSAESNVRFSLNPSQSDTEITINASVEILNDLEGEYYLGLYLVESGVAHPQSGYSGEAIHNGVLRASFTESLLGNKFASNPATGTQYSLDATLSPEGGNVLDRDFQILAIVWKFANGKYQVENLHQVSTSLVSSVEDEISNSLKMFQNERSLVLLYDDETDRIKQINLFNISGQKILQKSENIVGQKMEIDLPESTFGQLIVAEIIFGKKKKEIRKIFIK